MNSLLYGKHRPFSITFLEPILPRILRLTREKIFELVGELLLLVGVEVGVDVEGRLNLLMTEALADQEGSDVHLDQEGGVGVPQVVDTDLLHAGGAAGDLHPVEEAV